LKKIFPGISGLALILALLAGIGLSGCSHGPTVPISHYTDSVLKNGYNSCLDCHQTGTNGAPKVPDNHSSYSNDRCLKCHSPG